MMANSQAYTSIIRQPTGPHNSFRYFLLPMRIPDWQTLDLKARVFLYVYLDEL